MIHTDLKPENILISNPDDQHVIRNMNVQKNDTGILAAKVLPLQFVKC